MDDLMPQEKTVEPLLTFKPLFWSTEDNIEFKAFTHMGEIAIRPMSFRPTIVISFYFKDYLSLEAEDIEVAKRIAWDVLKTKMMEDLLITSYQRAAQ